MSGKGVDPQVFMAVGLDSGIKESDFKRKRLHLVIVLDVSGSMGSPFDQYYYDMFGQQKNLTAAESNVTKINVAKEVLKGILGQLHPDDLFSIVLFSTGACTPKRMGPVRCADMAQIEKRIDADVAATMDTNLSAGLDAAEAEFAGCQACKGDTLADTETRIMLITDEQPNAGTVNSTELAARMKGLADRGIFLTIIGVGLDFNTELVELISKVRGALYFSVHSPGEFKRRLVQDFDYAVSPLVFDLSLAVDAASLSGGDAGWRILHVYGSPNTNDTALSSDGTIMRIDTLFPSPKTDEGIKGGVVLMRMAPPQGGARPLTLTVGYTDRAGKRFSTKRTVPIPDALSAATGGPAGSAAPVSYFQSSGVEKAILLARYSDMLQGWLVDEWKHIDVNKTVVLNATLCKAFPLEFCPSVKAGTVYGVKPAAGGRCQLESWLVPQACLLPIPFPVVVELGEWERQSQNLTVSQDAKQAFKAFLPYLKSEMKAVNDSSLQTEVDLLNTLLAV